MSEAAGKEYNNSEPSTQSPADAMEPGWPLSPRAVFATLIVFLALVFHPNLVNLLVSSEDASSTLQHVKNFYLWTRHHREELQELKVESQASLTATHFLPRRTYVIIHGFLGSGTDAWIIAMKDALLGREDCNVIGVNWSAGAMTIGYYAIQSKVPGVGEDISKLLLFLERAAGLSPDLVHIIGHSLGAHAAGFTGKHLNGTLSRITGLDPAGLSYHAAEPADRLDKRDAVFVDIIHTHGCTTLLNQWVDCFGINENLGDADFWPNGGERQPACMEGGDGPSAVKDGSSCDHGMAYVFYTESISYPTSTTHFLARPCSSWKWYNICECSHPPQYMGYNVNPNVPGDFYLNTSITAPYALLDQKCSAGSFSTLQIIGLILVSILLALMILLVVLAIVQQYFGVQVLTTVRTAFGMEAVTWQRFAESKSTQLLTEEHKQVIT
ncbi:pancreatic triacylglycerol lipase-like [Homarus americanus]|uniref:pancreatic triacylglycerol lipase-like n=1 Tax=Homarus americanus TaxID=6706 RepID=UPI001C48AD31|nr:pancreatic triacylglycerol lipase-like [Homarus americanus]XP_042216500.1 pancreatic triacylglycerol lipase-like [Homarus americanus]XP_042216502.1 pancreatic triacylglycerol lipase-like [Homarus americanus]XP_042216503.1 pancreatic triacylglycerol lipase-like [Homarus americanus]